MLKSIYNHFITPLTSRKLSAAILGNVIIGIGVAGLRYSTLGNDPYSASTMAISDGLGMGLGNYQALLNLILFTALPIMEAINPAGEPGVPLRKSFM